MTPQERDLIQSVFDRLSRAGVGQKDGDAEALIRQNLQRFPDASYGLVQAVIVQEMALNQANARLNDLQRQLDEARAGGNAQPTGSGGFLGGASPWGGASVPRSGPAPAPLPPAAPAASPWGQPAGGPAYAPPPAAPSPWGQPSAAGGFLRNAATMAAGVAGGTLIAEGISSLFGGHHMGGGFGGLGGFGGASSPLGATPGEVVENVTVNNYYGDQNAAGQQDADYGGQDAGYQDASYDDSGSYDDGSYDDTTDV